MLSTLAHGGRITWDELMVVLIPLVLLIALFAGLTKSAKPASGTADGSDEVDGREHAETPRR